LFGTLTLIGLIAVIDGINELGRTENTGHGGVFDAPL
jgi:hypothetical protein